jgi:hypothetical protein
MQNSNFYFTIFQKISIRKNLRNPQVRIYSSYISYQTLKQYSYREVLQELKYLGFKTPSLNK